MFEPAAPDGMPPLATAAVVAVGLALAWLGLRIGARPRQAATGVDRVISRLVPRCPRAPPSARAVRVAAVGAWLLGFLGLLLAVVGAGLALARLL